MNSGRPNFEYVNLEERSQPKEGWSETTTQTRSETPHDPDLRDVIRDCFRGIVFYKKEDTDNTSIYVAKMVDNTTSSNHSFIVLVCPINPQNKITVDKVCLESVQTRVLPDYFSRSIPNQVWKPGKAGYYVPLTITNRTRECTTYTTSNNKTEVMVMHNPKKKDLSGHTSATQYPDKFTLLGALETWSCVVYFKDDGCKFEYVI
jgi:hypothetical protein